MALSRQEQEKIAVQIKNFFNTLPKEVVGASYDAKTKTVNVQIVQQTVQKPLTGEDLFGDIVDLLRVLTKR